MPIKNKTCCTQTDGLIHDFAMKIVIHLYACRHLIFNKLVKDPFFARIASEKANVICTLTKNSFKKNLNAEYAPQVSKHPTNLEIIEWLHTKHTCLVSSIKSSLEV